MTILLGVMLGAGALYLLRKRDGDLLLQLRWGTLLPAFFWAAQTGAFLFPGAGGIEAEFPELAPKVGPLWLNEAPFSLALLVVLGVGYRLERKARSGSSTS